MEPGLTPPVPALAAAFRWARAAIPAAADLAAGLDADCPLPCLSGVFEGTAA